MLLVSKVRPGGGRYYLEPTGAVGGRRVEADGYWIGRTRTRFGLAAVVEPSALDALIDGRHPVSADDLGAARQRLRVAAFDLTFCAPKSVSLLYALGDTELSDAVVAGHEGAVSAAMSYVEDRALAVRRVHPGVGRVPAPVEAAPAAAYLHRTSRALDPHLHTHVIVPNLGQGPDSSWSALDGRGVYAHAGATSALYHAHLRHALTASVGVDWGPLRGGRADVAGVGDEARLAFSRRGAEIAAHLEGLGLAGGGQRSSPRASTVAALVTRPDKDLSVSVEELRPHWRQRARAVGLGPKRLEALLDRVPARARDEDGTGWHDPGPVDLALVEALGDVRHPGAGFSRRHAVRAWAASQPRGAPSATVEERVDAFMASSVVLAAQLDAGRLDGPGVAERGHVLAAHLVRRISERARHDGERRRLEELLHRRGMSVGPGMSPELGRELDEGMALGR